MQPTAKQTGANKINAKKYMPVMMVFVGVFFAFKPFSGPDDDAV
jgi:hypothetical protein